MVIHLIHYVANGNIGDRITPPQRATRPQVSKTFAIGRKGSFFFEKSLTPTDRLAQHSLHDCRDLSDSIQFTSSK